jgi:hypothetical protein
MDWLLDHFQFVLIIGFALASWLKSRADAKRAEEEERQAQEEGAGNDDGYEPEEDWQLPPAMPTAPPPLIREVAPPPLYVDTTEADAILKRQQEIQERLQAIKDTKATTSGNAAETRARIAAASRPMVPTALEKSSLRSSLRDPMQTRRAIVLREILGPPVGLR